MPQIRLASHASTPLPAQDSTGTRLLIPRLQFLCWVRLPNSIMPRDAVIDTGSPFTWFPEAVWSRFQRGVDYEELPFEAGFTPPVGQTAGWRFTFRMARMLQPVVLFDTATELERVSVIVQFADSNPPAPPGSKRPPRLVIGLWGGVLEGTTLRMSADPQTGHPVGSLEW